MKFGRLLLLAALSASPAAADDAKRLLALGGSVTEIIYALGQQDRLIARDSTSTFPPEAMSLPDLGYLRALSPEGVLSVAPDLILAEPDAGPPEVVAALKAASVNFVILPEAGDPAAVEGRIRAVAEALGMKTEGEALAKAAADEMAAAVALGAEAPPKKVMFILSAQGGRLLAAGTGTAADAMIRLAGAENAMAGFDGYKPVSDEAVIAAAPEVVVMMDRGDHSAIDAATLFALPALAATPAAEAGAFVKMDGLLLLGFGPRTGQAIAQLHKAIQSPSGSLVRLGDAYDPETGDLVTEDGVVTAATEYITFSGLDITNAPGIKGEVHEIVAGLMGGGPSGTIADPAPITDHMWGEAQNLIGSSGGDRYAGTRFGDTVQGMAGSDTLLGNAGADRIDGGLGADVLTGGAGRDTFVFKTAVAAKGDRIVDFNTGGADKIDLSAIDAISGAAGNQGFDFIGSEGFHHLAGELRLGSGADRLFLYGDTNGDGVADFRIVLNGVPEVTEGSFIL